MFFLMVSYDFMGCNTEIWILWDVTWSNQLNMGI
jgi:hypothetical protein